MEVEMLISSVRDRRPIWDTSHKLHSKRDHIKKLWDEISDELGIECSIAKKKWRGLRENFRKEQLKIKSTTGQAAGWQSRWAHYSDLSFLQNQFLPRMTTGSKGPGGNYSDGYDSTVNDADHEEGVTDSESFVDHDESGTSEALIQAGISKPLFTPTEVTTQMKRQKDFKKNMLQKMVELEERKVEEYLHRGNRTTQEVQDADYHFLMSLLPSLRAIPAHRKMLFRRKMEDLFLEEEEYNAGRNFIDCGHNHHCS